MTRVFQILAAALIGFAAYFLWKGDTDGVFISLVLSAVSFLLSLRFQIKARIKEREAGKDQDIVL